VPRRSSAGSAATAATAASSASVNLTWDEALPARMVLDCDPGLVYEFDTNDFMKNGPMGDSVFLFEHTDGCVFCQGLYGHYRLPNGRLAHVFKPARGPGFSIPVLTPPEPWLMHPSRLLFVGPLPGGAASDLANPQSDTDASKRYIPIPVLAPDPDRITLDVVDTDSYANLAEAPIELYVEKTKLLVSGKGLKIEGALRDRFIPKVPEKPFDLNNSVFAPRKLVEADCRGFYETASTDTSMFQRIWRDMAGKQQSRKFMSRELGVKNDDQFGEMATDLHNCLEEMWPTVRKLYEWFCLGGGSGDAFTLSFNGWTLMHQDLGIVDEGSKLVQSGHVDNVFYSSNFMDKKDERANQNSELSLNRHEFMEALLRLAHAKFVADPKLRNIPGVPPGPACLEEAITKLVEEFLGPRLPPAVAKDRNSFLRDRLYNREVNNLYKGTKEWPTLDLLKEIYAIFSIKRPPFNLDTKGCTGISLVVWLEFLDVYGFIGKLQETQISADEGKLIFRCSQMNVVDEYHSQIRMQTLRWVDFLEAIGRLSEMLQLPTLKALRANGYSSHIQWGDLLMSTAAGAEREAVVGEGGDAQMMRTLDDVDTARPLVSKIECILDLLFARIAEKEEPTLPELKVALKRLASKSKGREYSTILKLGLCPARFIRMEYDD